MSFLSIGSIENPPANQKGKQETVFSDYFQPIVLFCFVSCTLYNVEFVVLYELQETKPILSNFLYLIINCLLVLVLICAYKAVTIDAGKIPQSFTLKSDGQGIEQKLNTVEMSSSGKQRICKFCNTMKPDRAHHCSRCGRCVLKMDHHCKWLFRCIGLKNYKFFFDLIFWGTIGIILGGFILFFYSYWAFLVLESSERTNKHLFVLFNMMVCIPGGLSCLTLFVFHFQLVLKNATTLEWLEKGRGSSSENKFDLGSSQNWIQVFGDEKYFIRCLLPFFNGNEKTDGINWPTKGDNSSKETV